MKRIVLGLLAVVLFFGLVVLPNADAQEKPKKAKYVWNYPSWEAPGSWLNEVYYYWWPKRVEVLTKGEVKFNIHPSQTLIKGVDHYESVRDGIIPFAPSASPYESDTIPLATVVELPFVFDNWKTYLAMMNEMMDSGLQDYYKSKGVYCLAPVLVGNYGVWTTKKWGPIRKLEDLKGCKIRTPGGYLNNTLMAMGAIPIAIPVVDTYMSLQTGVIDGASLCEASQITHKLDEVIKYACRVNYGGPDIHIVANLKVWNELPKHIRDAMLQASKELQQHYAFEEDKYIKETAPKMLKKSGVELIYLTKAETERMRKATKSVREEWQKKYGKEFNGLGDKLLAIVDKYRGKQ
ncbi:MAG: hypothetical protein CVU54_12855 [Deltaproteobacteria bacterium HGW-Deltaproteobacteria-12]|jgi:TRAP-type C4-dicarboxylate transport system substrate-binding protein|nr:MAG: hypothetical protein CVU54_12855 [Deltaproteobacteria bacterium HGW-Deltaproteobacteria-12]